MKSIDASGGDFRVRLRESDGYDVDGDYGYPHEHWAHSDRLNASSPTHYGDAKDGMVTQWGDEPPDKFHTAVKT